MEAATKTFPENFVWGAATAAYQIEGSWDAPEKGLSTWDVFSHQPGAVWSGHTGDRACDHVERCQEDVRLMSEIGLNGYRFSINWARVLPEGRGKASEAGLGFYDRLVDKLLEADIQPFCTLFHWDYPHELFCRGGWLCPDSPSWFADFADLMARRLGDRVKDWFTLNEPGIFLVLGHVEGSHAPGLKLPAAEFFRALKHTMLAHGKACQALRAGSQACRVSYAPHCVVGTPATDTMEDIDAARQFTFGKDNNDRRFWQQRLYLDPPLLGEWPEDIEVALSDRPCPPCEAELRVMRQPLDFLGLNYYFGDLVRGGPGGKPVTSPEPSGGPRTHFDWPLRPEGLYWAARFHAERYGLPIVISENGMSGLDWVSTDGKAHDHQRIDFMRRYLGQLRRACSEGIKVLGYFHWSLLDNFEWAEGYRQRFGLIHVDFETQRRTVKDSGHWYRRVIETNGAALDEPPVV